MKGTRHSLTYRLIWCRLKFDEGRGSRKSDESRGEHDGPNLEIHAENEEAGEGVAIGADAGFNIVFVEHDLVFISKHQVLKDSLEPKKHLIAHHRHFDTGPDVKAK